MATKRFRTRKEGFDRAVDLFRLSRFAEGKPIRGSHGDWLMC